MLWFSPVLMFVDKALISSYVKNVI